MLFLTLISGADQLHAAVVPDFRADFDLLSHNRRIYRQYEDSVYSNLSDDDWLAFMMRRSSAYQSMFSRNMGAINHVLDYFRRSTDPVPDAAYDSLYNVMQDMGRSVYGDLFLLEELNNILLPHYEACADTARLVMLYHYSTYYNYGIARSYEKESAPLSLSSAKRNIELGHCLQNPTSDQLDVLISDYVFLCQQLPMLGVVSPREVLDYTDDFELMLKRWDGILTPDQRERGQRRLNMTRRMSFRTFSDADFDWFARDSASVIEMFEVSPFCKGGLEDLASAEDTICYYQSLSEMGRMDMEQAFHKSSEKLFDLYLQLERKDTITEYEILSIGNSLIATLGIMDKCKNVSEPFKMQCAVFCTYRLVELVKRARIIEDYTFFDYVLSCLASNKAIMRHLPTGMKEDFMCTMAVKQQVGTVVHVTMVEMMCEVMLDALLDDCPQEFVGVMGTTSVDEVLAQRNQFKQYVTYAALFHDLGKTQMAEIVSNDFRRLTDHEFAIIKKHPELSLEYLNLDPLFDKYKDVALGHHKWYNGQGGYPASFDNVSSPYRPMIDLLTICDCIDAATDYLNRNYRTSKPLEEVLREFQVDAGKRYNPVMVKAICSDSHLINRLKRIIVEDRARQASMVRQTYIKKVK